MPLESNEPQDLQSATEISAEAYSPKRQYDRYKIDVPVKVFAPGKPGHTPGRSNDLCFGGMSFYAPTDLTVGQEVQVHFSLPYSRVAFGVAAAIRDVNGFRYGVEFERLTPSEVEEMERVLKILAMMK